LLWSTGQRKEALASYEKAIALDPKNPDVNYFLSLTLRDLGKFAEARDAAARAVKSFPSSHPRQQLASKHLKDCERLAKLESRLPRILSGEDKPASSQEWLDAAEICRLKDRPHAGVRLWTAAFAADRQLADDLKASHRYNAACQAALAAAGMGEDAVKLDDAERARLRTQALDWLRADLAARSKQVEGGSSAIRAEVRRAMLHWQKDSDLAGIRDKAALEKLPPNEQRSFTQLWDDVAALLKKAETPATQEGKQ
jgi:tetratricopeptide (TPR) repeat protein